MRQGTEREETSRGRWGSEGRGHGRGEAGEEEHREKQGEQESKG